MRDIAGSLSGGVDEILHHGPAVAIDIGPHVGVDDVGLARRDEVRAAIVIDEEEALFAIDHRREDLHHLFLCGLVIGGGGAIDEVEPVAGLRDVVAQFSLLGLDQLGFKLPDLALGQIARLRGHKQGDGRRRKDQWQRGQQKELLPIGQVKAHGGS